MRKWWRRRESNPTQPIEVKRLKDGETPTDSGQKSNTTSTLADPASNLENPESNTSQTVSGQNPDTVEDGFCGHCVAHSSARFSGKTLEAGRDQPNRESALGCKNSPDDLESIVKSWALLSQEVKDSILAMAVKADDSP